MNVFEAVRENGITARQAAEHCGIKINRSGMAVCPFHKDKNPSMKIDSRYYCFGCGEKGDAVDFVAKFYGLGKRDAALQIASDFGISFDDNKGRKPPPKRKRRLSSEQSFERAEKKCFRVLSDYLCCLRQWKEKYAPHKPEEEWRPLFCEALGKKDYIEYLLDILLYAPLSERVELVTDYGKEVLRICISDGLTKKCVLPLPEPPITRMFLLRAYFGCFGRLFMVSRSVCVKGILFSNTGSVYG